jgi:hypothetical protein
MPTSPLDRQRWFSLQTYLVADGLTDSKIKLAVQKCKLEGASFHHIMETIKIAMKAQASPITTSNREFKSNTDPQKPMKMMAVATNTNSTDKEEVEAAAVAQCVKEKKKKKKDKKKQAKAHEQMVVTAPRADKLKKKKLISQRPPS